MLLLDYRWSHDWAVPGRAAERGGGCLQSVWPFSFSLQLWGSALGSTMNALIHLLCTAYSADRESAGRKYEFKV